MPELTLTPAQRRSEEARLQHAIDRHGLHSTPCTNCGGADLACTICNGHGLLYDFTRPRRCGPDCPLWMERA